jgi:uncharacterized protein
MTAPPPAIADQLIRLDADGVATLLGGRDRTSGRIVFPAPDDAERFDPIELPRTGRLWSWTIQRFRPKSPPYAGPEAFEPYAVGYVALGDAIIVEGRLTGVAFDALCIDMPMRLTAEPFLLASGEVRLIHAFAPAGEI